jgi:hypothetical protein
MIIQNTNNMKPKIEMANGIPGFIIKKNMKNRMKYSIAIEI